MKISHVLLMSIALFSSARAETVIVLDATDTGRTFEGIGAVSAGASSRHLIDFPEQQRAEVLDYLFKPKFGASLQHLKVEIGGDENSTCGSEPTHAITREELKNPKARGYELWMMAEARKRNPQINLDCLPWSYPAWISDRFSQDSADWFVAFLDIAKKQYQLDLDWIAAAHNERGTNIGWITNILRPTLDKRGYAKVKLQAPDHDSGYWKIFDQIATNPALDKALQAVGYHYVSAWYPNIEDESRAVPEHVKAIGKPLWASEDFTHSGKTWDKSLLWAQLLNKFYIRDRITKTQAWCPVDSILPGIKFSGTGLMHATQSWSGYYEVWPAIWTTAHTTQFAEPGWLYMDKACGKFEAKTWKGSYVALRDPAGKDWSLILCTSKEETVKINIAENLHRGPVHIWKSTEAEQFIQMGEAQVNQGVLSLNLEKGAVYSLTTTTGQKKGNYPSIPASAAFAFPYSENFEQYSEGVTPKYFVDQKGTFETSTRQGGEICLQQISPKEGTTWRSVRKPHTIFGDDSWTNYSVQAEVLVNGGSAEVGGRYDFDDAMNISLLLHQNGQWSFQIRQFIEEIKDGKKTKRGEDTVLASGTLENFKPGQWQTLKLFFVGSKVIANINGQDVGETDNFSRKNGMAVLSTTYHNNCFDNIVVAPLPPHLAELLNNPFIRATASSENASFPANFVLDENNATFWHSEFSGMGSKYPHEVVLESTRAVQLHGVNLLPRQDGSPNGWVKELEIKTSADATTWTTATKVSLTAGRDLKCITFPKVSAKFIKVVCLSAQSDRDVHASFAEISPKFAR